MAKAASETSSNARCMPGFEQRYPADQNAIDLLPGWNTAFPHGYAVEAGILPLYDDDRIKWAITQFGDIIESDILELGPLEASHTFMLAKAGARVDAIESHKIAYLKCLVAREILGFENVRFHLGDFNLSLEQNPKRYDLIIASGVLYHMQDPLRLLAAMSRRSDALYIWSVCIANDKISPTATETFMGTKVRLYERRYGKRNQQFCGGAKDKPRWLHRDDVLNCLRKLGYDEIKWHETNPHPSLGVQTFSFFARRTGAKALEE